MAHPLIGVTMSVTFGQAPERTYVSAAYLRAIQGAGGIPVLLPPHLGTAGLDALWQRLDGVVLTGGGDIDPARFGETPHPTLFEVSEARDALELDVTTRALGAGVPLLTICRGLQVLNVALGGTLHQDIATGIGETIAHRQRAPRDEATHAVKVMLERGALGRVLGVAELGVNSFHHQAIKRLGRGLEEAAWAPDGVVEGVDLPGARGLVLAVQWHPEDMVERDPAARRLFAALVEAAASR